MASDRAKRMMAAYRRQGQTELLTYRPHGSGERTIEAIVSRGPFERVRQTQAPTYQVQVLDDAEAGITRAEIDRGADTIDIAELRGGTPAPRHIQRISEQDNPDWMTLAMT